MVQLHVSRTFSILCLGNKVNLWKIRHVSLNATKSFQVVFEVRKGAGNSSGGFSIDDINLSETRCPDYTLQFDNFQRFFETSLPNTVIYSPRLYSTGGYAYTVGLLLQKPTFAVFVQLLSGVNDERLEWPCLRKQFTFKMLDQSSNIQQQMSKQGSFTSDLSKAQNTGKINKWELIFIHLIPPHLFPMFCCFFCMQACICGAILVRLGLLQQ